MFDTPKIAPSILSANFMELGHEIDRISTADYIHFDVMDGRFVPNLSFGLPILRQLKTYTDLPIDVHLMIDNPDSMIDEYIDAGADIVCFHLEAATHPHRIISRIHEKGRLAAIALNPGTPVSALDPLIYDLDMVLIMSVNPGYGGQKFIDSTVHKLKAVRALCTQAQVNPIIEVDGGINTRTAELVCRYGANLLVAGSSVFHDDYAHNIAALRKAAQCGYSMQGNME